MSAGTERTSQSATWEEPVTEELIGGTLRRLERLERENRRLKVVVGSILLGLAAVGLVGQAGAKSGGMVVEAEQFLLRDSSGVLRAALKTAVNGPVGLALADTKGQNRMLLDVDKDGLQGVSFYDERQRPRAVLAVLDNGGVGLTLSDQQGQPRVVVAVKADGSVVTTLKH